MEIEVKGHSGCKIEIIRKENDYYIEKSTHDATYCARLIAQLNKQSKALETGNIYVPKIISIDASTDSVVGRMEYVYSQNFIDYFETSGYEGLYFSIKQLTDYLRTEIVNSPIFSVPKSKIIEKFDDVCAKISKNTLLAHDKEISVILQQSRAVFNSLPNELLLPVGVCHGDLTFSNILFNKNGLYLIDFLDSFIETPLMDIVKLRQDTSYGWSRLMHVGRCDDTRLKIVLSKIDEKIVQFAKQYSWYNEYYQSFQLMNFLRILQYAKEVEIVEYLKENICKILKGESYEF